MPDIKFPEMRMPEFKLPEGLRDMSREDIQKAMSDVRMPDVKMPDVKLPDVKLPKRSDLAKSVEKALPMRSGPSPVPFAVLAMLGGLIVGWILATSPRTAPRINAAMAGVRQKIDEWRAGAESLDDELDIAPEAFRDAFRAPTSTDKSTGAAGSNGGVGAGVGRRSEKTASDTKASISTESVTSDR